MFTYKEDNQLYINIPKLMEILIDRLKSKKNSKYIRNLKYTHSEIIDGIFEIIHNCTYWSRYTQQDDLADERDRIARADGRLRRLLAVDEHHAFADVLDRDVDRGGLRPRLATREAVAVQARREAEGHGWRLARAMLVEAAVVLNRLAPASHPALPAEGEERVLAHAPGLLLALHDEQSQHRHLAVERRWSARLRGLWSRERGRPWGRSLAEPEGAP